MSTNAARPASDRWGERTPYSPGTPWPVRPDANVSVEDSAVQRWVQSASLLHSNGDALDIAVSDGRIVGVRGRAEDRVNRGRLDVKDLYAWQANNSPDRLTDRWCGAAAGWRRPTGTPRWTWSWLE